MKYEKNQPVVRGRASILHTDIEISFYEKHQLDEILVYLVDKGYTFSFEEVMGDSLTLDVYKLYIEDISWANNVTALFKELEKLDYNAGMEGE